MLRVGVQHVFAVIALASTHFSQAQDLGCSSAVSLDGGTIEVEADASVTTLRISSAPSMRPLTEATAMFF